MQLIVEKEMLSSFDSESIYTEYRANSTHPRALLVVVHGLGGDSNASFQLIERLLKEIPNLACLAYDQRGHGFSSRRWSKESKNIEDDLIKDLRVILKKFKSIPIILLGESFGGVIVQEYVLGQLRPRVKKSILLCSHPYFLPKAHGRSFFYLLLKLISILPKKKTKKTIEQHAKFRGCSDLDFGRISTDAWHVGLISWALMFLSLFGWKNSNWSEFNTNKTIYAYGVRDQFLKRKKQEKMLYEHQEICSFALNTNHCCLINNPELLVPVIQDTIEKL